MPGPARAKEPPIETLPLEARIQRRAYELYVVQGNQSASELDDWLQAEEEIRSAEEQAIHEAWRFPVTFAAPRYRVSLLTSLLTGVVPLSDARQVSDHSTVGSSPRFRP